MSIKNLLCSKVTKRSRMKVRLTINGFLLSVLLVSHAEARVVEISAYGDVSSQRNVVLRNSTDGSAGTGRAMGNGGLGNIFDGMLTKPVSFGTSRSQDSSSTKHIVYPGNSQAVDPPKPLKAVASNRSTSEDAYDRTISRIPKDKQENRKEYQYQGNNASSFNDSKVNSSSSQPSPSTSPSPSTVTIPRISNVDHDQDSDHHDESSPTTTHLALLPPRPLEYGTARVKAYSYFYLSRTLWYVPLYFTLYFCFYILILVIRSIARHKVTYPNAFTGRSRAVQDMQFITNEQAVQKADMLTTFVMKQIDDFKDKYIG